jgi:hypothetical protein
MTAICALFAASATRVKSFRNTSVDGAFISAGGGGAILFEGDCCVDDTADEDDEKCATCCCLGDEIGAFILTAVCTTRALSVRRGRMQEVRTL